MALNKNENSSQLDDKSGDQSNDTKPLNSNDHPTESKPSETSKKTILNWWQEEKHRISKGEMRQFISDNKEKLEKTLSQITQNTFFYRLTNRLLLFISFLAGWFDKLKEYFLVLLLKLPGPNTLKSLFTSLIEAINFKGIIEFIRAKFYSFKKSPHHLPSLQLFEDMLAHARQDGLDLKKYFPDIALKYQKHKQQILQHSFFKEFTKNWIEKTLAIPFLMNRSIYPILPDTRLWHKLFDLLERRHIKDLILVDDLGCRVSFKNDSAHDIESSLVKQRLYEVSLLKSKGKRIFIVGHHESYVGPYCVRSVLRKLGFENLAGNCNTIVGPRMFSNIVLKNGARNVGNLFLTLPSQKTTTVSEKELAEALTKTARQTQFLIKMPDAVMKLVSSMSYKEFMDKLVRHFNIWLEKESAGLSKKELEIANAYFHEAAKKEALNELSQDDYELFKKVMYEPFLIFPEGSRSYVDENGNVTLKYVNPRYVEAYFRPGDIILPLSLVGGSDITKGLLLSVANLGLSVGEPIEVTEAFIERYSEEGIKVMKIIASLPNIKKVYFDSDIQKRPKKTKDN